MMARSKNCVFKPKVLLTKDNEVESLSVQEALRCPPWLQAMNDKYTALMQNQTWSLVSRPFDQRGIGCKWVFMIKRNTNRSISRYKARLLAK